MTLVPTPGNPGGPVGCFFVLSLTPDMPSKATASTAQKVIEVIMPHHNDKVMQTITA
jgi:hypothetical protein